MAAKKIDPAQRFRRGLLRCVKYLNTERYFERTDAIGCAVLGILTQRPAFLFGPPGTAKSAVISDLCKCIDGSKYFETLISKTTRLSGAALVITIRLSVAVKCCVLIRVKGSEVLTRVKTAASW